MKLDIILIIGLVVNTFFAVLYPAQIFGSEPLGLSGEADTTLNQYYKVNGSGLITGVDSNGQLLQNKDQFDNLKEAVQSTDGDAGIFGSDIFKFLDWVKIGFNLLKTLFMFLIGFIILLWNLVYPLNFLIGIPFSLLYLYSIAGFIMGR